MRTRRGRGSALAMVLVIVTMVTACALALLGATDAFQKKASIEHQVEQASAVADGGLAWIVEQWREQPTILDTNLDGADDGVAATAAENAQIGVERPFGQGTFTLMSIRDVVVGPNVTAKIVTVRARQSTYRRGRPDVVYTWEALLSPNLVSPIQGVGTRTVQSWKGGATFQTIGGTGGTIFANGNITLNGAGTVVTGDAMVKSGQSVTVSGGAAVTGNVSNSNPAVTFPSASTKVNGAVSDAQANKNTTGYWRDAKAELANAANQTARPSKMEVVDATASNLGSGWSGTNKMNMRHLLVKGGNVTLPAGNYAFGRLWVDGGIVTIKAPPGGTSTIVLSDLFLENGARLILDTSEGQINLVTGANNAYDSSIASGSGKQIYDSATNTWGSGTLSEKMTGDTKVWTGAGGASSGIKDKMGTDDVSGYDDWQIEKGSVLATVTTNPDDKGVQMYMGGGGDLVLVDGSRVMSGVPASSLPDLQNPAKTIADLDGLSQNATGFLVWSAGSDLPRFNVNAINPALGRSVGAESRFTGLTYGEFEGTIGANAKFTGAYVGRDFVNEGGDFFYDAALARLLVDAAPDSQHVVTKRRIVLAASQN